jgi:hypothetical protein
MRRARQLPVVILRSEKARQMTIKADSSHVLVADVAPTA